MTKVPAARNLFQHPTTPYLGHTNERKTNVMSGKFRARSCQPVAAGNAAISLVAFVGSEAWPDAACAQQMEPQQRRRLLLIALR